jgi:hypothetical protein
MISPKPVSGSFPVGRQFAGTCPTGSYLFIPPVIPLQASSLMSASSTEV